MDVMNLGRHGVDLLQERATQVFPDALLLLLRWIEKKELGRLENAPEIGAVSRGFLTGLLPLGLRFVVSGRPRNPRCGYGLSLRRPPVAA